MIREEGRGHGGFIQRCAVGRVLSGLSRQPSRRASLSLSLSSSPSRSFPLCSDRRGETVLPTLSLPYPNSRRTYVLTVRTVVDAPVDGHRGSTERTTVDDDVDDDDDDDYRPFSFLSCNHQFDIGETELTVL